MLGTGYSHDGSACLLKDGKVCVAIEKERITRRKHDGHNDTSAIQYCLDAEGITMNDVSLVVQNSATAEPVRDYFQGERIFAQYPDTPVYTISHHLAHAYSTIGTCPFKDNFNIMVIDGNGSSYDQCIDLPLGMQPEELITSLPHLFYEKDSYYSYSQGLLSAVYKDFSEFGFFMKNAEKYTRTKHSIGGAYELFSKYCFANFEDTGKLMGLAPYGRKDVYKYPLFECKDGRVFINYDTINRFQLPARSYPKFREHFQYYADIAHWVQQETEKAVLYIFQSRLEQQYAEQLCYAGGVALNAVVNAKILEKFKIRKLYMQPAAGDNGVSIGCAYYGWLEILKKERVIHNSSTFFGKPYNEEQILGALENFQIYEPHEIKPAVDDFFRELTNYHTIIPVPESLMQINLKDIGLYQLELDKHKVSVHYEKKSAPTSSITLDGQSFMRGVQNPSYFNELINNDKLEIFNPKEVHSIFISIDLKSIFEKANGISGNEKKNIKPFKYRKTVNRATEIAQLLSDGKVIGLFQGGSEFGPRALGNRSIIADPRISGVRDFINKKIKLREDFRPFAPAILQEDLQAYFKCDYDSPYMILINEVRPEWKDQLKSVIHEDDSSRVQTVTKDWNRSFYDILTEFKKITGLPIVLNTSFNKKGMPIVETPQEALYFFVFSKLDCLVMDDYIIERRN